MLQTKIISQILSSNAFKNIFRFSFFGIFAGILLGFKSKCIYKSNNKDSLKIIVFSSNRYEQDLDAISKVEQASFYTIPLELFQKINAIFSFKGKTENIFYHLEEDPVLLNLRDRQVLFLRKVGWVLKKLFHYDIAITPSMQYVNEKAWVKGLPEGGLPFVAIHKEFTLIDEHHIPRRVKLNKEEKIRFEGSRLLVTNQTGKELFIQSNIFAGEKIGVVGLPRMDRILKADSVFRKPTSSKQMTMFSFGHFSGDMEYIPRERKAHYFSINDDLGFVELVRDSHAAFARAALKRPDFRFVYKPKYNDPDWFAEIDHYVEYGTGKSIKEIKNLEIVFDPAPDLICQSTAVVGFNSTVVIEARALDKPTLIPVFAEAVGAYKDNVFFRDYLKLFETPSSAKKLEERLLELAKGQDTTQSSDRKVYQKFIRNYLGYDDGRTSQRVIEELKKVL
ncbi:CDP-glycerol glycerophosphotransferase family protein [Terasakiella sp. SH-1]|uniref:CDP-glycerol glycerophosphotransferase family protein n=1 Tax=Terasakiella sp. SH-1 TaxID=2560057 RepID=UPI0010747867|nr:CDP-glycerol glycerophosphotransferase family protein [Terasakiella sp. SH-1]